MKLFSPMLVLTLLICCTPKWLSKKSLSSEMQRLNVATVLLIHSQAIDEYPLWSSNSEFIATNIMGTWYKFNLTNVRLIEAEWHKQRIAAVVNSNVGGSLLTQFEQQEFQKKVNYAPRKLVTTNGDQIELRLDGLSTSLIITKADQFSKTLWTSNLENCHSLSLSPDQNYVAYLCELNGLFVMKLSD
jgi:hypothetical protein